MQPFQYLLLLGACLVITLPLEFVLRARVYRRPLRLALSLAPVVIIFACWDVVGILRGHWDYNPRYVTGVQVILGMPIEELAFFIVIPLCGLLTYEAVGRVLEAVDRRRAKAGRGGRDA